MDIAKVVRFVYNEAKSSMDDPWAEATMAAVVTLFEGDHVENLTSDGFFMAPIDSERYYLVGMKEYRGTIFIRAVYPDEEGRFSISFGKMAFDQKMARAIFDQAGDELLAA